MTIGVTGASGHLGRLIVESLKTKVDAADIVAFSRTPENLADLGVTVRAADFQKPESLAEAFAGIDRLVIISTANVGTRVQEQKNALVAAKEAGVDHLFYTSAPKADQVDLGFALAEDHRATEAALAELGMDYTALRINWYAENVLDTAVQAAQSGTYLSNQGDGKTWYLPRTDIAEVIAAVLASGDKLDTVEDVTGAHGYTQAEVVAALNAATGKSVQLQEVDDATYQGILESVGLDAGTAGFVTGLGKGGRDGALDIHSDLAEKYLGRKPASLEEFFTANKSAFDA